MTKKQKRVCLHDFSLSGEKKYRTIIYFQKVSFLEMSKGNLRKSDSSDREDNPSFLVGLNLEARATSMDKLDTFELNTPVPRVNNTSFTILQQLEHPPTVDEKPRKRFSYPSLPSVLCEFLVQNRGG